jgi:nucleotide-binding universal stress UspA family protein
MYNRILATLDGSRFSEAVLPEVLRLAVGTSATVHLLAVAAVPEATTAAAITEPLVVAVPAPGGVVSREPAPAAETKTQALERTAEEIEVYLEGQAKDLTMSDLSVEAAVRFGDPATEILKYATEHQIEVIVMATHGRTRLATAVFGSVAKRVAQIGKLPVLLVRPPWLK